MSSRNLLTSVLMACFLAVGFLGIAPVANAESLGQPSGKSGKIARDGVIKIKKRRVRRTRIHLPIGPASVYYDYPYYYCRGHYPTHIGGYVYYPYYYYRGYYDYCRYSPGPGSRRQRGR